MSTPGSPASVSEASFRNLYKPSPIELKTIHRRLAGQCRALLVSGSDNNLYAIKLLHPGYTPSMRASEALAAVLARHLDLPVAGWTPMVPASKLGACYKSIDFMPDQIPAGPEQTFYASRIVQGAHGERPYEVIPTSWQSGIVNRHDLVGMALFDLWTGALHHRQMVFAQLDDRRGLRAVFIDHCHALGGPSRQKVTGPDDILSTVPGLYGELWTNDVVYGWMNRLQRLSIDEIDAGITCLPASWVTDGWRIFVLSTLLSNRRWMQKAGERISGVFRHACNRRNGGTDYQRRPSMSSGADALIPAAQAG